MLGKLSPREIEEVLQQQMIGRIGCHADGTTYIVPISYVYDAGNIYAHSKKGMKVDIMTRNPDVCFEVEIFENMAHWKSVITWGRFEEITDKEERNEAIRKLRQRNLPLISSSIVQLSPHWPFGPVNSHKIEGIVFKITVDEMSGRFENTAMYDESHAFL